MLVLLDEQHQHGAKQRVVLDDQDPLLSSGRGSSEGTKPRRAREK
jgi:hypothetical protein